MEGAAHLRFVVKFTIAQSYLIIVFVFYFFLASVVMFRVEFLMKHYNLLLFWREIRIGENGD